MPSSSPLPFLIREETAADFEEIYHLIRRAFETAEHCDGNEQDLVVALRKSSAFIPELSLVAQKEGILVGHILLTEARVGSQLVLALAPLCVAPTAQNQGIGTALLKEAQQRAQKIALKKAYSHIIVLGSEHFYPRVGYAPAENFGIKAPEGLPSENFMALALTNPPRILSGSLVYAPEFTLE